MMKLQCLGPSPLTIKSNLAPANGFAQNHPKHSSNLPSPYPTLSTKNSEHLHHPVSVYPPEKQSVAAIVFGDGSASRLYPLTKRRSEGAIPIAANYRLIDAVVSNCINSDISKIYAITQFNSTSLNSHLSRAYSGLGKEGLVEVIAACQSHEHQGWFQGTADAIRRCLWVLEEYPVSEYLVLPGHHLYRMDYQKLIQAHRTSKADITIAALSSMRDKDPGFGLLKVNSELEVMEFSLDSEKEAINHKRFIDTSYNPHPSMGIYLINRNTMEKLIKEDFSRANDLGSEVIRGAVSTGMKVRAYLFDGYWEDVTNIEAFYRANMECIEKSHTGYNFYDKYFPVYTMPRCVPPTLISGAVVTDSLIGDGCILNGCKIRGTILGMRTRIGEEAIVEDSIIMGSDFYQEDIGENGRIPIGIGENTQIRKAIIDKNARIGRNVMIINRDNVQEGNREDEGYIISGGIVVVLRSAEIPNGRIL